MQGNTEIVTPQKAPSALKRVIIPHSGLGAMGSGPAGVRPRVLPQLLPEDQAASFHMCHVLTGVSQTVLGSKCVCASWSPNTPCARGSNAVSPLAMLLGSSVARD